MAPVLRVFFYNQLIKLISRFYGSKVSKEFKVSKDLKDPKFPKPKHHSLNRAWCCG